jgi:hypothetical protein
MSEELGSVGPLPAASVPSPSLANEPATPFTPGPWERSPHSLNSYSLEIRSREESAHIATVGNLGSTSDHAPTAKRWRDETVANAHLIAAAPAMYEALRGAIGALEFSRDFHNDLGNEEQAFAQDRLDAALAILAQAEGAPQ